jgi:NAD(P)-dependent dehydrogenase (short-subunit alcohol dehydrogenase family)
MVLEAFDVRDRVILITGSASGIGLDMAKCYLQSGAYVVINSRNQERLDAALHKLGEFGERVMGIRADGRREEEVQSLIESVISRYAKIDVLINNAGGSFPKPSDEISGNGWNAVVQTNLSTVFLFSKAVYPHMKKQGYGKIINISSVAGLHPSPKEAHYGAAKAAVIHLTQTHAHEWGQDNIQVNCVAPGPIATKLAEEHLWATPEKKKQMESRIALGRIGDTQDVFYACLYLSAKASDYVTGAVLTVDGGTKW